MTDKVVIIGAGTAGLHAAFELAETGVASLVIDSAPCIGGVVYRGAMRRGSHGNFLGRKLKQTTESLYSRLKKYDQLIGLRLGTEVIGPTGTGKQFAILSKQTTLEFLEYSQLIVCVGCYEQTTPFPGWTLPGVMALGGAQLQIKNGLVHPGKRMVICGSGPLVPVAALQMYRAGVEVVGLCEANQFSSFVRHSGVLFQNTRLATEGLSTLARLWLGGIRPQYGWGLVEARGGELLEEVVIAPYDDEWKPDHTRAKVIAADCLATGYGFVPRTELTRLLGAEHRLDEAGGFVPVTDEMCRTSLDGVYVAGDVSGIQGGQIAAEMGKLAAVACLEDLALLPKATVYRKIRRYTRRINRFRSFLRMFPDFAHPQVKHVELATENTIICRCENVIRSSIDLAVQQGVVDLTTLKMVTRVGMGDCQGKICASYCSRYLTKLLGTNRVGELKPRFPLIPIPFSTMLTSTKSK
jgi:hydrogen cyanide synthase HcnB